MADLLPWMLMSNRVTQHMQGAGAATYSVLDTDPNYPAGFPSGLFFWVKNRQGYPADIEAYDGTYAAMHYITEDGDPPDQAICNAAGYNTCWNDPFAYKRFLTPVPIIPRNFTLGGSPVTIDTPGPNTLNRTTNCESTYAPIDLGDVRAITSGPFNLTWGGSIDHGAGGGAVDAVNGVPTLQNDYYYDGTIGSGIFISKESTFYVQPYGRVAWKLYTLVGGVYQFQRQSINNNIALGGVVPQFPCGWSFSPGTSTGSGTGGFSPGSPFSGSGSCGATQPVGNPNYGRNNAN